MTVRASHLAFLDLSEFEHYGIRFAAVHTRMRRKKLNEPLGVGSDDQRFSACRARNVNGDILEVMLVIVGTLALATTRTLIAIGLK